MLTGADIIEFQEIKIVLEEMDSTVYELEPPNDAKAYSQFRLWEAMDVNYSSFKFCLFEGIVRYESRFGRRCDGFKEQAKFVDVATKMLPSSNSTRTVSMWSQL